MRYDLMMLYSVTKDVLKHTPTNFFEIGSRDGNDAHEMSHLFNIPYSNCYIFEAHPECYNNISQKYKDMNVYNCAITNQTKQLEFNAGIIGVEDNIGCSSLLQDVNDTFKSEKVLVDGWRFDEIASILKIQSLDLLKIDVEGHTMEVLEGFGDLLNNIKVMQLELEHKECWIGQKTYNEVANFLIDNNFEQVAYIKISHDQSDSLWANKNYFKI